MATAVEIERNEDEEGPVPTVWRSTLARMVDALCVHDYKFEQAIEGVPTPADGRDEQMQSYIARYGQKLVPLPPETWATSCYIYGGYDRWSLIVDLYTVDEGRSDLILEVDVIEADGGYSFVNPLVYVP